MKGEKVEERVSQSFLMTDCLGKKEESSPSTTLISNGNVRVCVCPHVGV